MEEGALSRGPRIGHLNWNLLRTFLVIVEERSITRAADRLLVRQPTVTASLQKLEETLGAQLILRDSRRFVLTPRGEALRQECLEIYRRVERIGERLALDEDDLAGQVRIMIVTGVAMPAIDRALGMMHRRHPQVSFRMDIATSQEIARAVSQRAVPFGFCLLAKPLAALECRLLMREEYGIFCGVTHALYGRDDVSLEDLRAEPFVSFSCAESGGPLEPMIALREGAGLGRQTVGHSAHLTEVERMIASGVGIGILPVPAARHAIAREELWRFPVLGDQLGADLYLLRNPEVPLQRAEAAFLEIFEGMVGEEPAPAA